MTATKTVHPCDRLRNEGHDTAARVLLELTWEPHTVYGLSFLFRSVQPCRLADAAETLVRYGYAARTQRADGDNAYVLTRKAVDESKAAV